MKPTFLRRRQSGISLIEALVALGVMAFGIMGIVGIQASLRAGSDISKQRAEASRLAQQMLEDRRSYLSLAATGDAATPGYGDVTSTTLTSVAGSNASFDRSVTVTDSATSRLKTIRSTVQWTDRSGTTQSVVMLSTIAGAMPELAATVGVPPLSAVGRLPQGRNLGIPRRAVDMGDGSSRFSPPGGGSLRWYFSNTTGYLTRICPTSDTCTNVNARLLAGYVQFETGSSQPTPAQAENPNEDSISSIEVVVYVTSPATSTVACFEDEEDEYIAYYCAVPVTTETPRWAGRSELIGLNVAATIASASTSAFKVCRYTTTREHTVVPTISNLDHPYSYLDVAEGLQNQNFLVMKAGDGSTAFVCPADDTSTPLVNGNTWHHQPSS